MQNPETALSVETIDSLENFTKCRENWDELYSLDNEADYFLSWDWLSQLFDTRDEGLLVLAVKSSAGSSRYCAFFPLRREVRFSNSRRRFFNSFSMAGNYWADSTGLVCDPEFENLAIPALAQALKSLSWQRVLFESVKISPHRKSLLMESFSEQKYSIKTKAHTDNHGKTDLSRSPYINLPVTFESYLEQKTSANTRQKIRRIRRKIEDDPALTIEFAGNDSIERYLGFFEKAWISSWAKMKGSRASHLAGKYAEFIRLGLRSDTMIVPVLLYESSPVGMLACYTDPVKKQLLFFVAARDTDFELVPGGLALHTFCIEWAIENGYTRYELLRGDESYKYSLGATDALLDNTVLYKRSPSSSAQILHPAVLTPALRMLGKASNISSASSVHQLYSQCLESWPGNTEVLRHYAAWLESNEQPVHANEITQSLTGEYNPVIEPEPAIFMDEPIDIKPYYEIQAWLEEVASKTQTIPSTGRLNVKGLKLEIASKDAEYYGWLKSYLYPLTAEEDADKSESVNSPVNSERYRLVCTNSDELVVKLMRLARSEVIDISSFKVGGRGIDRIHVNADLTIDLNRHDGVVWVSDKDSRQLTLLLSSRVRWPSLEVSRTARTMITGYLQQEGWLFFHSGAVRIEEKNYLVIGDEGQGKTSLLLALMSCGCPYISNERVYVRKSGDKIETLSFPMPVAIGLGAAQQYPEIMQYIYNPEFCLYPHRRLSASKLRSTPESRWSSLSDKAQLLGPELVSAFGADAALQGGEISGVIVPAINKSIGPEFQDKVNWLDKKELKSVVSRNYISVKQDSRYPAWLPTAFNPAPTDTDDELIESICALPGVRFIYHASQERGDAVQNYPTLIQEALFEST